MSTPQIARWLRPPRAANRFLDRIVACNCQKSRLRAMPAAFSAWRSSSTTLALRRKLAVARPMPCAALVMIATVNRPSVLFARQRTHPVGGGYRCRRN